MDLPAVTIEYLVDVLELRFALLQLLHTHSADVMHSMSITHSLERWARRERDDGVRQWLRKNKCGGEEIG